MRFTSPRGLSTTRAAGLAGPFLFILFAALLSTRGSEALQWSGHPDRVTADIHGVRLTELLRLITDTTGWQVYVQPNTEHVADVRFTARPTAEALKLLLGDLNFALITQTNAPKKLMVFRTGAADATEAIVGRKDPHEDTSLPIPNELVVTVKPGVDVEALAKKHNGKVIGKLAELRTYRLQFETAEDAEKALKELNASSDVEKVQRNYYVEKPPEIQGADLSSLPELGLKPSSQSSSDCGKVIIGLIDTTVPTDAATGAAGAPGSPSGLSSLLMPQIDVAGASPTTFSSPPHGRSMAEAIARSADYSSKGKAQLSILPVNVYGPNAQANTFDVALGVYKAIGSGAKIINMSLGSDAPSPLLDEVIRQGKAQDVMFVAAAGNKPTTTATYPAADPDVLAVTASDRSGNLASYANRGDFVDVVAPGSTVFPFNGQYYLSSGTSVATAYVSGLAGAMADPCKKTYASVESQIRQNLAVKKQ
ncbi:MAG: S8 family serine peptidase [Verrucomicrobia bacterium]|nr:S8 family serine peptidase [Verrucomicrobiota bacterium]